MSDPTWLLLERLLPGGEVFGVVLHAITAPLSMRYFGFCARARPGGMYRPTITFSPSSYTELLTGSKSCINQIPF